MTDSIEYIVDASNAWSDEWGVVTYKTFREFHAFSQSRLKHMTSINAYVEEYKEPFEPTIDTIIGDVVHLSVLEPQVPLMDRFSVIPEVNRRTKDGKAEYERFEAQCKALNKQPISAENLAVAERMAENVKAHPLVQNLMEGADTEVPLIWWDEDTSFACKGLLDIVRYEKRIIADLKTAPSCDVDAFARQMGNLGYYLQPPMYIDGLAWTLECDPDEITFVWVIVEKKPPYEVAVYPYGQHSIDLGRMEYKRRLKYARRFIDGDLPWLGKPITEETLELPVYLQKQLNRW